jgi:hypothetical protein
MKTLVGAFTVGAVSIVISAFMQTADAQQFRQPRPDDPERLRRIRECMGMEMDRKHNYPFRAGSREHMYHACMADYTVFCGEWNIGRVYEVRVVPSISGGLGVALPEQSRRAFA